jgi:hypothetical protein
MSDSQDPPEYIPPGAAREDDPATGAPGTGEDGVAPVEPGQTDATAGVPAEAESPSRGGRRQDTAPNMLPGRERRRFGLERVLVRLIATCGIVGIGVAIAAIMVSSKSQSWLIGLVVSGVSVILSAILWSSRSV